MIAPHAGHADLLASRRCRPSACGAHEHGKRAEQACAAAGTAAQQAPRRGARRRARLRGVLLGEVRPLRAPAPPKVLDLHDLRGTEGGRVRSLDPAAALAARPWAQASCAGASGCASCRWAGAGRRGARHLPQAHAPVHSEAISTVSFRPYAVPGWAAPIHAHSHSTHRAGLFEMGRGR
jgi:hypothetical protein